MIPPGFKLVNYFLRFSPFRIRFRKFFGDFLWLSLKIYKAASSEWIS